MKKINNSTHDKVLVLLKLLSTKKEAFWIKRGNKSLSQRFEKIKRVPAYKNFLTKKSNRKVEFRSVSQLNFLPLMSKKNYFRVYPFSKLFIEGELTSIPRVISTTSGSTGEPFYFPRTEIQDQQYQIYAEMYLRTNFNIHKKKTLYIDAFPMGPWIGGVFTYEVINKIARESNYPLSIITTGIDINSTIQAVKKMGSYYDQIIIGAYGPFAKDILDTGLHEDLHWERYNIKFIFSAEAFPESFRDYVVKMSGNKNILLNTLNHYGTADLGTMSYETPICILIRRLANKNKKLYQKIFGNNIIIPTLTQYLPEMFYFESIEGNLVCTSDSAIPIMRYDLGDKGDVIGFEKMLSIFREFNINLLQEANRSNIKNTIWYIPFVFVFERSDFSVSYYAFQVYPSPVRKALLGGNIQKKVTGKFTLESSFSEDQNPKLVVHVELKRKINASLKLQKDIENIIHNKLLDTHSEYKETIRNFGDKAKVFVKLWTNGSEEHFKIGIKQKWIKK